MVGMMAISAQSPADAAGNLTLTVAQGGEGLGWFPAYVAREKGYFTAEKLDVKFVITPGGSEAAAAVVSGSADIADAAHHAIRGQMKGYDFVLVANSVDQYAVMVVVSTAAVKKAGLIKGAPLSEVVKKLRGLRIGISSPGSSTDMIIRALFALNGMNGDRDATLIPFGTGGPMQAALETNQIDAFVFSSPFPEIVQQKGEGEILINLANGELPQLSGYPYTGYFTTRKVIQTKPAAIQAFVNAIYKAEMYIHAYPEESVQIAQKSFPDLDPKVLRQSVMNNIPAIPDYPVTSKAQIETTMNWLKLSASDREKVPYSKLVDNSFAFHAIDSIGLVPK
jgi:NitT/TauT family transport system substrate-binding protein